MLQHQADRHGRSGPPLALKLQGIAARAAIEGNMKVLARVCATVLLLSGWAACDEVSGPGHTTLRTFPFGSVYYVTDAITGVETGVSETVLTTASGKVTITSSSMGSWTVQFPGAKWTITEQAPNGLLIENGGKKYQVDRQSNETTFTFPGDKVTYQTGLNELKIHGQRGDVNAKSDMDQLQIDSKAGKTTLKSKMNGFELKGPAVNRHPYLCKGWTLEQSGVGILINLSDELKLSGLGQSLDWNSLQRLP